MTTEHDLYDLRWEPYVWRGALGGAIGTLVVILAGAVYVWLRFGAGYLDDGFIIIVFFGPIGGVITGVAIGYIIYRVSNRMGKQLNKLLRIAIGVGCVFAFALLTSLTKSGPLHLVIELGYAVAVGGLAGLMARAKNTSASVLVYPT